MYKIILSLFLLFSSIAYSTDEIVIKKNNKVTKITFLKDTFLFDNNEGKIYFKPIGTNHSQMLRYTEFDYVEFDGFKFQVISIENKLCGFFVLAESSNKKFLVTSIEDGEDDNAIAYLTYIVSQNGSILEKNIYDKKTTKKSISSREEVYNLIRFHFPTCSLILDKIEHLEKVNQDIDKQYVLKIFSNPIYTICKD